MKYLFILILSLSLLSCSKQKPEPVKEELPVNDTLKESAELEASGVKFKVQYEKPRRIHKIDNIDLNNDGIEEVIVMSVVRDEPNPKYYDYYNFDMIQVFRVDAEGKSYERILSDTVDYSVTAEYVELTNDRTKQLLIKTNTGGNSPIASAGMFVYNMQGKELKLLRNIEFGNPEVQDINGDGKKEIIVHNSYWGVMPQMDNINFISEIYRMENGKLEKKNADYPAFFEIKITEAKTLYSNIKKSIESGKKILPSEYPLYKQAVGVAVNYLAKEDGENLRIFWEQERDFLKAQLPEDQFIDLQNYILRVIPLVQRA